jgi:hypothetical protein
MPGTPRFAASVLVISLLAGCAGAPQELPMDPSAAEPPVVFEMPESICVAEKQQIAFVPDLPIDIFSYEGKWFWKIRDTWYWSRTYMGMLYELTDEQVPKKLLTFGEEYRTALPDCTEYSYEEWDRIVNTR